MVFYFFFVASISARIEVFLFIVGFPFVSQSSREIKAAAHVLQTIWSYKDLRTNLYKAGWKKSLFKVK